MTFIALVPPIYTNVLQYGADPTGGSDSTAAFAAAVTAAGTGGTVFLPAGTYKGSVSLSGLTDVTLKGAGSGSILLPPAAGTGVAISNCTRCHVRDLKIDGSSRSAATGISIDGDFDGRFDDIQITGFSGDGISVQGDNAFGLETHFNNITTRNCAGYGYHYVRTTNTDRGGVYVTNFLAVFDGAGIGGVKLESSSTTTGVFHFFVNLVIDNMSGSAIWLHNTHHCRFVQVWGTCTNAGSGAIIIDGDGYLNNFSQVYLSNGGGAVAGTCDILINDTQHDNVFDNIEFDGIVSPGTQVHVGSTGANNIIDQYVLFGAQSITDTSSAFFLRSGFTKQAGPITFVTAGNAGDQSVGFDDPANAGKQKWIRNANGSLQVLNTAFSATIFRIDDSGFVFAGAGIMPSGNTAGACTFYSGSGAPATGLGAVGDYYFRSDTPATILQRVYTKTASAVWTELQTPVQSATAVATATGGTIATSAVDVSRVSPTGAVTGVILASGTYAGQKVTVVNEAVAANTVTFAASGTSHVSDGVSSVIAGLAARTFVWNSSTSLWYPSK